MRRNTEQHPIEAKMEKISTGFRGIEDKAMVFSFAEGKLLPEEVLHRFQRGHDAFGRVRQAEAELKVATAERERLLPVLKRLCDEALVVAKRHYGGDAERMATFGVEKGATAKSRGARRKGARRCRREPSRCGDTVEQVVTTVVEEVVVEREEARCEIRRRSAGAGLRGGRSTR